MGLVAIRRSPAQEEKIIDAFRASAAKGILTAETDFIFHLAVAETTNNPCFSEFLQVLGPIVISHRDVAKTNSEPVLHPLISAGSSVDMKQS